MTGGRPSDRRLDPLFEAARFVEPVSQVARTRALSRARARVARGPLALSPSVPPARASFARRAVAIAAGFALMATGVAAAFLGRAPASSTPASGSALPPPHDTPTTATHAPPPAAVAQQRPVAARVPRHVPIGRDPKADELAVLRRAQVAYSNGEYQAVVDIVGQHARRFSNGRLAEEAEALRVRSLARCGRLEDAFRALDAFANRFPHSVLLTALRRSLGGER